VSGDLAADDGATPAEAMVVGLLALYAAARRLHEQATSRREAGRGGEGGGEVVDFRAALRRHPSSGTART
jgi:hypothetical protein